MTGTTLWLDQVDETAALLPGQLGYTFNGQEDERYRFSGAPGGLTQRVRAARRASNGSPPR